MCAPTSTGAAGPRGPTRSPSDERWRRILVVSFVTGYVVAGSVALIVCLVRLGASTAVLRGLAAAFLGTSVATLTAFLDLPLDLPQRSRRAQPPSEAP